MPNSTTSCFVVLTPAATAHRPQIGVIIDDCNFGTGQEWHMYNLGTNLTISYINIEEPLYSSDNPPYNPQYCRVQIQGQATLHCNEVGTYGPTEWNQNDGYLYQVSDTSWTILSSKNSSSVGLVPPSAGYLFRHPQSRTVWITVTRYGTNCIPSSSSMRVSANCEFTVIVGVGDWHDVARRNPPTITFLPSPLSRF